MLPLLLALASSRPAQAGISAQFETEPLLITATRNEAEVAASPAAVTVLDHEALERSGARTLDDALRQVPGFNTFLRSSSLATGPAEDPEAQGVSLRGVGPGGASRALVLVDG